jgi:hypothetical protein
MRALQSRKVWQGLGFGLVARGGWSGRPARDTALFGAARLVGHIPLAMPSSRLASPSGSTRSGRPMHPWLARGRTRAFRPCHPARKALSVAWVRTQSIARYAVSIGNSAFTTREAHAKWPPLPIGRGAATSSVPKCQSGSRRLVGPTGPDCRCEIGDSRVRGHAKGPGPRPAPFRSNAQCSLPRTWSCAKPLAARQDPNRSRNSRHTTVRPYSHEGPFEGTIEDLCSAPF